MEFSYNNGYKASLKMSPFDVLYGKKCDTPMSWESLVDMAIVDPNFLKEMEE